MDFRFIDGTITTPQGFTGAAICGGIKEGNTTKKDIMMVKCDTLCNAAAVYTKNLVKSDAILVTQEHLKNGKAQAIVANSGNANTCNADGYKKASDVCKLCASTLNIAEDDVIVASTGVIGVPLPLEPFEQKLYLMKKMMSSENGSDCAEAIMTTDTVKKEMAMEMTIDGKTVTVGGIAKGSGMIHINMGTMLSFVTTDCAISSKMLEEALKEATAQIVEAIHSVLEKTPPELAADIADRGIVLTGGGSLLQGLEELIEEKTGINTMTAEDPMTAVAIGTGKFIEFLAGER